MTLCCQVNDTIHMLFLHQLVECHNDYDLAVANTAAAVRAGFHGVHVTVNGLGERAGNAPLSSAVAVLHDRLGRTTGIDETKINRVSRTVESYTGIRIPANRPIVGASVFTQCAGIHADGDSKNNLYFNELLPERFGRVREYALGKTSGKANVLKNLEALGIDLDEAAMRKVTERVVELSDKKEQVTAEDLPYIIADVLRYDPVDTPVRILNYSLSLAQGMHPAHRLAMLRNMMNSLLRHEAIKTTLPKAKELRRVVEPMITLAKEPTVANKRLAFNRLRDREIVVKLFNEIGPMFKDRKGGYTRILKMGYRVGDNAPLAYVELVQKTTDAAPAKEEAQKAE